MAATPTSRPSWQSSASQAFRRLPPPASPAARPRVAILGVGQELNGDDGAGVLIARRLKALTRPHISTGPGALPGPVDILIVEAAHAPENCLGPLLRFAPALVIFVDAAEMGEAPGTIRWLRLEETAGIGASTHTLPPAMLARFLVPALDCQVAVLGIQPAETTIGAPLSPPVAAAAEEVVSVLRDLLASTAPLEAAGCQEKP